MHLLENAQTIRNVEILKIEAHRIFSNDHIEFEKSLGLRKPSLRKIFMWNHFLILHKLVTFQKITGLCKMRDVPGYTTGIMCREFSYDL